MMAGQLRKAEREAEEKLRHSDRRATLPLVRFLFFWRPAAPRRIISG